MSDHEKTTPATKAAPAPFSEAPEALKGKPSLPPIVIVEDTQPGRAWTFVGTGVPQKHSPQ